MDFSGCSCALRSYEKSHGKSPNDSNVKMLLICSITPSKKSPYHAGFSKNTRSWKEQLYLKMSTITNEMKTLIQIHKEGKFSSQSTWLSTLLTRVYLRRKPWQIWRKLEEHYQILQEMASKGRKVSFLDIEVEKVAQAGPAATSLWIWSSRNCPFTWAVLFGQSGAVKFNLTSQGTTGSICITANEVGALLVDHIRPCRHREKSNTVINILRFGIQSLRNIDRSNSD